KILSWLYHAKNTLRMEELQEILSVEPGDSDLFPNFVESSTIVEVCQGLVVYDEVSHWVSFSHSTVNDYLQTCGNNMACVQHAHIVWTYLTFQIFCKPCLHDNELHSRIKKYKFSRHAAQWWPDYVRAAAEEESEVKNLVVQAFSSPLHLESL